MNKTKVLYIDPMSYSNLALYDYCLLSHLDVDKIEIFYACSSKYELKEFSNTFRVFKYQERSVLLKPFSYLISLIRLYRYIQSNNIQIIHIQWFKILCLDLMFVKILKKSGVKVIYTAHNVLPHDTGLKYKKRYGLIYKNVEVVIVHTKYAKEHLLSLYPLTSVQVVPHGLLNLNEFVCPDEFDEEIVLPPKSDTVIYAFLGNLSYYKGFDIFVDAWLSSSDLKKNTGLIIAGRGFIEKKAELENFNNVYIFNKYVSNKEFSFFLDYADYIVMPYREIAQSGLLLTVLERKKKIIVSNLPPLTEPFSLSHEIGYILKENNYNELSDLMHKLSVRDLDSGEVDWDKISEFYSWESIAKKMGHIYMSPLKKVSKI